MGDVDGRHPRLYCGECQPGQVGYSKIAESHEAILQAAQARDEDMLQAALTAHLDGAEHQLLQIIDVQFLEPHPCMIRSIRYQGAVIQDHPSHSAHQKLSIQGQSRILVHHPCHNAQNLAGFRI